VISTTGNKELRNSFDFNNRKLGFHQQDLWPSFERPHTHYIFHIIDHIIRRVLPIAGIVLNTVQQEIK